MRAPRARNVLQYVFARNNRGGIADGFEQRPTSRQHQPQAAKPDFRPTGIWAFEPAPSSPQGTVGTAKRAAHPPKHPSESCASPRKPCFGPASNPCQSAYKRPPPARKPRKQRTGIPATQASCASVAVGCRGPRRHRALDSRHRLVHRLLAHPRRPRRGNDRNEVRDNHRPCRRHRGHRIDGRAGRRDYRAARAGGPFVARRGIRRGPQQGDRLELRAERPQSGVPDHRRRALRQNAGRARYPG